MNILIISAFSLCLFFAFLIFAKNNKSIADNILIIWLGVTAFHFTAYYCLKNTLYFFDLIIELSGALVFVHGPLILCYLIFIHKQKRSSKLLLLNFIPFCINLLLIPYLIKYDKYPIDITLAFLKLSSCIIYPIIILYLLDLYNKKVTNYFSEIESKQLVWLKIVAIGILVIALSGIISLILTDMFFIPIALNGELYIAILLSLFIFIIGFNGLKQTNVFIDFPAPSQNQEIKQELQHTEKYKNTGLSHKESKTKFEEIKGYVTKKQTFLDPELTLFKLAELLEMPVNKL